MWFFVHLCPHDHGSYGIGFYFDANEGASQIADILSIGLIHVYGIHKSFTYSENKATFPRDPGSPSENGFMEPKYYAFRFGDWTPQTSSAENMTRMMPRDSLQRTKTNDTLHVQRQDPQQTDHLVVAPLDGVLVLWRRKVNMTVVCCSLYI